MAENPMDEVLPFLFVGSQTAAEDIGLLDRHGVTYVLNVSDRNLDGVVTYPEHFARLHIPLSDFGHSSLGDVLTDCFTFINEARDCNTKALVHCQIGVNRSASVTIAYLMKHLPCDLLTSCQKVKKQRSIVFPVDAYLTQLLAYELTLQPSNSCSLTDLQGVLLQGRFNMFNSPLFHNFQQHAFGTESEENSDDEQPDFGHDCSHARALPLASGRIAPTLITVPGLATIPSPYETAVPCLSGPNSGEWGPIKKLPHDSTPSPPHISPFRTPSNHAPTGWPYDHSPHGPRHFTSSPPRTPSLQLQVPFCASSSPASPSIAPRLPSLTWQDTRRPSGSHLTQRSFHTPPSSQPISRPHSLQLSHQSLRPPSPHPGLPTSLSQPLTQTRSGLNPRAEPWFPVDPAPGKCGAKDASEAWWPFSWPKHSSSAAR